MKTVFLIRGLKLNKTAARLDYSELRTAIQTKGYRVIPVDIAWNHKTISKFTSQFIEIYNNQKSEYNIIIGNSFGAMVAFKAAPRVQPDEIMLCSLSGLFSEDLHKYDEQYLRNWLGKRRVEDLKSISADEIAMQISDTRTSTAFLYGEKEKNMHPILVNRVRNSAKNVKNSRLIEIPGAGHRLHESEYTKWVVKVL